MASTLQELSQLQDRDRVHQIVPPATEDNYFMQSEDIQCNNVQEIP